MNLQLRKYRRLAGLNQQQTADALKVKVATYRTWENGRRNMSFPQAIDCAELFGCTTDELAGLESRREYSDPAQAALNGYYESMNTKGRSALVESARLMSGSPDTRIEKDRPEPVSVPAEVERIA